MPPAALTQETEPEMFVGCEPESMRQAASACQGFAHEIRATRLDVSSKANALEWHGPDADAFRARVGDDLNEELTYIGALLDDAAETLRTNADEQDEVSSSLDAAGGAGSGQRRRAQDERRRNSARDAHERSEFQQWWRQSGHDEADRMASASPSDQAAWWASLPPDRQRLMLAMFPGFLIGMAGLSPEVRQAAVTQVRELQKANLVERSETSQAGIDINVPLKYFDVHLGGEGEAKVSQLGNGDYLVDLTLSGKLGAAVGSSSPGSELSAGGDRGGSVSLQYRFHSRAEADAFVNGFADGVKPHGLEWAGAAVPGVLAADAVKDGVAFLGKHSTALVSTTVEGTLSSSAEMKVGGGAAAAKISAESGVGMRYNVEEHTTTLIAERQLTTSGHVGGVAGESSLHTSVELTTQGQDAKSIKLTADFTGTGGADLLKSAGIYLPVDDQVRAGMKGSVEIQLALDDPLVANRAQELVTRVMNGDSGALDSLQSLARQTEVKVQLDNVVATQSGFDAVVVEGHLNGTLTNRAVTFVKPAGAMQMVML